jgi:N-acetyl-anhydromuramyl-L-alanine amidase AmpD
MSSNTLVINHYQSPNFNERPSGIAIDTVIVHATVLNTLKEVISVFESPESKVSAHYTIDRDGTLAAHVSESMRAWHAGESLMPDGRPRVNDFSIGIELVNLNDGCDPYPDTQIEVLNLLLSGIKMRHPIQFVLPHYEVAHPPGRKSDPKGLDFKRVLLKSF